MNRDPRQGPGAGEGAGELPRLGGHGLYGDSAPPTVDGTPAAGDLPNGGRTAPPEDWITQSLPPGYQPPPLPRNFDKLATRRLGQGGGRRWMVALSAVLALVVAATTVFYIVRNPPRLGGSSSTPRQANCQPGTACAAANAFLTAYSGGDYEKMYTLTSAASQKRFNSPTILRGNYKDAHDYIVNRTSAILAEASVGEIDVTPGQAAQKSPTQATVPVHITMNSARVGQITQDLTLPLVKESGQWRVDWSPGLIFSKIDDPADPTYARRVHMFPQDAHRGSILDAGGDVLAQDGTAYAIEVTPKFIQNESLLLSTLGAKLDMRPDEIKSKYAGGAPDQPHTVRVITPDLYNSVQAALGAVSGITVDQVTRRVYPYGTDMAAVTGYMSEISADELKADSSGYYDAGDFVGRDGVEQWGEKLLRPIKGGKLQIVDVNGDGSNGQVVTTIGQRDATPGADIHTTISLKYQQITMAQLAAKNGKGAGVVALDPVSGALLVLASSPIYNPNDFTLGFTQNGLDRFNALDHPYLNRALSSAVPVGSVMKVTTLAAALENGVKPADIFTCKGSYQVPGEDHLRIDDRPAGHGSLTAPDALGPSCDVIFWQIGVLLNNKDPNLLPTMAKAMGYGSPTGIVGIPDGEETGGLVPDPQWLRDNKNAGWTATDAANLAIGQGFFEATPAQTAMLAAAIGDDGKRMQPRLVSTVTSASGATIQTYAPKQIGTLPISADNLAVIQAAMLDVTASPAGTSYPIFKDVNMRVAGKTGTAESGQSLPHAWFMAYAPASPIGGPPVTPQMAMGVVVQFVGFGATDAAPISRKLIKAYFNV